VEGGEVDEVNLRAGSDLDEVDFRLRRLLIIQLFWRMTVFEIECDVRRICVEERLEGLVGVLDRLEKEDGDGVVYGGRVVRSASLDGVEKVLPLFVRLLLQITCCLRLSAL